MTLDTALKRGDLVEAKSPTGSVIVGQADHDMSFGGSARLSLRIQGEAGDIAQSVSINVNFWNVRPLVRNILTTYPEETS